MSDNSRIEVEFGAKTSELDTGAKRAGDDVQNFGDKAEDAGKRTGGAWAGLAGIMGRVFGGIRGEATRTAEGLDASGKRAGGSWGLLGGVFSAMASTVRTEIAGNALGSLGRFGRVSEELIDGLRAKWDTLPPVLQGVARGIIGLGVAVAGIAIAKRYAADTAAMTESTRDFARALDLTTNETSVYQAALADVGATEGEFEGLARGLSRQLREKEADLKKMGLATRDASGELRPLNELTLEAIELMNQHKSATDKSIAGQQLFGRAADASSRVLLLNKQTIEENRAAVEELGLTVGRASVDSWKDYDAAADRAELSTKGITKAIGESLMPVATIMANWFSSVAPAAITVLRGGLSLLSGAFIGLAQTIQIVWEVGKALFNTITEPILAIGRAHRQVMQGDIAGAMDTLKGVPAKVGEAWSNAWNNIIRSAEANNQRLRNLWTMAVGGDTAAGDSGSTSGGRSATVKGEKTDKSFMDRYEAILAEEKRVDAILTDGQQYRKQQELAFWQSIIATTDLTAKDKLAIQKKTADLEAAIAREGHQQRNQIEANGIASRERMALAAVDGEARAGQVRVQMGLATSAELAKAEVDFEQRRNDIRVAALQERLSMIDPARDPVQYAAVSQQIADLEKQHQQKLTQLEANATAERAALRKQLTEQGIAHREALALAEVDRQAHEAQLEVQLRQSTHEELLQREQQFEQRRNEIRAAALQERLLLVDPQGDPVQYESILQQIEQLEVEHQQRMQQIRGQASVETRARGLELASSLEQGFAGVFSRIGTSIRSMGDLMRATSTMLMQVFIQLLSKMAAEWLVKKLMMLATSKLTAAAEIKAEAARAGAGGTASWAGAPWPINVGAPAFGAAMSAAAMAYMPMASAAGGYDIPAGLNPLTQLHEKEMVLPAHIAQPLREGIAAGVVGAGSGDTFQITALDARSFKRMLEDNPEALAAGMRNVKQNFFDRGLT